MEPAVEPSRNLCVQIVGEDKRAEESKMSLGIGCTSCDPSSLRPEFDLPNDSDKLLDRPEYWVVYQNLGHKFSLGLADELCFRVDDSSGDLSLSVNGNLVEKCLFSVDLTQRLWFFFDLCGSSSGLRLMPSCKVIGPEREPSSSLDFHRHSFDNETRNATQALVDANESECRICWDCAVECVIYPCGHMCLCWKW